MTSIEFNSPAEVRSEKEIFPTSAIHLLANFSVELSPRVLTCNSFRSFMDLLIDEFKLIKFGEVYQDINGGGFAVMICLENSHLSIRSKPELNTISFDVFISNALKDNHATMNALYQSVRRFFDATVTFEQFILR